MTPQEQDSRKIHWNKVTWYSQLLAIVLAVIIFFLAFYLGTRSVPKLTTESEPQDASVTFEAKSTETEWIQGAEYNLDDLTFEYPSNWKITRHGTNQSDEDTSALFIEGDGETAIFLNGGEAALIDGCEGITFVSNIWSPTIERIFDSAKCLGEL